MDSPQKPFRDEFRAQWTRLRKAAGLNQTDAAKLVGISQAAVSDFERGGWIEGPTLDQMARQMAEWNQARPLFEEAAAPYNVPRVNDAVEAAALQLERLAPLLRSPLPLKTRAAMLREGLDALDKHLWPLIQAQLRQQKAPLK